MKQKWYSQNDARNTCHQKAQAVDSIINDI